jgi:3-hydroxyisobutyrate dehydrogenase-like beta-hydroxyacid dehydrogenase
MYDHNTNRSKKLVFLGFGEVSSTFYSAGLKNVPGLEVAVFIPIHPREKSVSHKFLSQARLSASNDPSLLSTADVVISLVTPSAALSVASKVAPHLRLGALYVDMNSISAPTAVQIGEIVTQAGADFVDAAILGPVPLLRLEVPIVLAGPAADRFHQLGASWGFHTRILSAQPGDASALKMLWSVITKGIIAIYGEALVAAQRMGLQESLRELIRDNFGHFGSDAMVLRLFRSTAKSGSRRLDEMKEAKATLEATRVPTWTVESTLRWIETIAGMDPASQSQSVEAVLETISANLFT